MRLDEVRRLTGASVLLPTCGAAGELIIDDPASVGVATALWRRFAGRLMGAAGWGDERVVVRPHPAGASVAVGAPPDVLFAATEIVEGAFELAAATMAGERPPDFADLADRVRRSIGEDRNHPYLALLDAARLRGLSVLAGEDSVSLGLGKGAVVYPARELPDPGGVDWSAVRDIPVGLVSGTNGKTTTVRLTAAIAAAAGRAVGLTSSDWVEVAGERVAEGDFSGPSGARLVLRDRRVDLAVLEIARGGLMRRGLPLTQADACVITNVAADHLGEYGIDDLDSLAEVKFVLAGAVKSTGHLILNADDPHLARRAGTVDHDIIWFTLEPGGERLAPWRRAGGTACFVDRDGRFVLAEGDIETPVVSVADCPLTHGGRARANVANGLAAIGLSAALGLPLRAMAEGLRRFDSDANANPGRTNLIDVGGLKVLIDFAHNPHGLRALLDFSQGLPHRRWLILLGQAGDRRDEDIRELTRVAWEAGPDRVIVKEMRSVLRGRAEGEVPALIRAELERLGAPDTAIGHTGSEVDAVRQALRWAKPGDLLVLLLHVARKPVLALLDQLRDSGWQAGEPLPE
jgi:UDP-N-acetylmuramyl tripeptide synthase